jgi:hypothetical protein
MPRASRVDPRRETFCRLYLKYFGLPGAGKRAAQEAKYSLKNTGIAGYLLAQPWIQNRINQLLLEGFARDAMTPQEIVARIARLARRDVRALFTADGDHILPHQLDPDIAGAIVGLDTELNFGADGAPPTAVRKYRLVNPLPALRALAEIQGMLEPAYEGRGQGLGDRLQRARARIRDAQRDAVAIEGTSKEKPS